MRIKKKETVLPFRETLAFRMLLLGVSVLVFIVALYIFSGAFRSNIPLAIGAAVVTIGAAFAIFYNLDHMKEARIPKQTMNRMKKR